LIDLKCARGADAIRAKPDREAPRTKVTQPKAFHQPGDHDGDYDTGHDH